MSLHMWPLSYHMDFIQPPSRPRSLASWSRLMGICRAALITFGASRAALKFASSKLLDMRFRFTLFPFPFPCAVATFVVVVVFFFFFRTLLAGQALNLCVSDFHGHTRETCHWSEEQKEQREEKEEEKE